MSKASYTYYEVTSNAYGSVAVLFGSYDKGDCEYELDAERDNWKEEGYKNFKIRSRKTTEAPDPAIYG